jgi:hypothetical protein
MHADRVLTMLLLSLVCLPRASRALSPIRSSLLLSTTTVMMAATDSSASKTAASRTALEESGEKGEFKRRDATWRNWVSKGECEGGLCCDVVVDC